MPSAISSDDLEQRLASFLNELDARYAGADLVDTVDRLNGWRQMMAADGSIGRVMTGPQWIDQVAIRDGVINAAKLAATIVIASTFTTSSTGTGARVEITANGFAQYNSSNVLVSQLRSDGSGFLGSTTGVSTGAAIAWDTTPAVTMRNTITIASGGQIVDANGSSWSSTGITLASPGSLTDRISFIRSGFSSTLSIQGALGASLGQMSIFASSAASSRQGLLNLNATGADGSTNAQLQAMKSGGTQGGAYTVGADGTHSWYVDSSTQLMQANRSSPANSLQMFGQFYPGTGAAVQSTGFIDWSGTKIRIQGADLTLGSTQDVIARRFYPGGNGTRYIDDDGSAFLRVLGGGLDISAFVPVVGVGGGASGSWTGLVPTHFIQFKDIGGTVWKVPACSAVAPWAA